MKEKIIILDGNSLLFRAFYAMPPLKTRKGQYTNAVFGFLSMLYKILDTYSPKYLCVAFDPKKPTFRHEQFKDYKSTRQKAPNELVEQFQLIRDVLDIHRIKTIEVEGFEADDVAGSIATISKDEGLFVYLVTSDRDYLQLIEEDINVLLTKKGVTNLEEATVKSIMDEMGITPAQVVDLKALMGDQSDNIPGVSGVGEKTALKLIQEYGSLDNIYANIDNIKGKLKEKLETDKMQAYMSQTLARIVKDIPFSFELEDYKIEQPDEKKLLDMYDELEFRTFKKRVQKTETNEETQFSFLSSYEEEKDIKEDIKNNENKSSEIFYIEKTEEIEEIVTNIKNKGKFSFKLLLDGERALYSRAIAAGLSDMDNYYYIDLEKIDEKEFLNILRKVFEDNEVKVSGHNIKNEIIYLMKNEVSLNGIEFDTEIGKYLLDPSQGSYAIDNICYEFLDIEILSEKDILGSGKNKKTFKELELNKRLDYMKNYLMTVNYVKDKMLNQITTLDMKSLLYNIELPLIEVLAFMEYVGFKVNEQILDTLGVRFREKIAEYEKKIYELASETFNINSPKQLSTILFEKLNLTSMKKTKTGTSTDAEVLEKLKGEHEIIQLIVDYRQMAKLNSTYVEGLKAVIDKNTNRIHSVFNQTIAATGRISSTEPNLQNIPIKTDDGRELRKAFVAPKGYVLCDADYSQIELRVLAHLANEQNLISSFENGEDIHTKTASEVFDVKMEDVTPLMRSRAKAVNFGIVYGISDYGLSRDLSIPRKESKLYIDNYLKFYSSIAKYMKNIVEEGKQQGYVTTTFGRRRYIPELTSRNFNIRSAGERIALNTPVQGTAADIIKAAMVGVYNALKNKKLKSRLILQIHDELIIETCEDEIEEVKEILKYEMESVVDNFKVKLKSDVNVGGSWYDAK